MPSFTELLQQGTAHAWLFVPSAILLGALHGLEPGHSKTMMAAFIVAIRGTVAQAVLLGLAATVSHTIVVWVIALGGMYLWQGVDSEAFEPYFQLVSAAVIIAIALWMLARTWQDARSAHDHGHDHDHQDGHDHHHDHDHHHSHSHGREVHRIKTPLGAAMIVIFEEDGPARWRVHSDTGHIWQAHELTLATIRPDGSRQRFTFRDCGSYLESAEEIPEPHEFTVRVSLGQGGELSDHVLSFVEHAHGLDVSSGGHQDAHEREHADAIRRRFAGSSATTAQIVVFGLTGGLIPCPGAITILLLCLQLKHMALGAALVLCFSIGLAITLVMVGVATALGVQQAARRVSWFAPLLRRAPYLSSLLVILVGLYTAWTGWHGLAAHAA